MIILTSYTNQNDVTISSGDIITKNSQDYLVLQINTLADNIFVNYREFFPEENVSEISKGEFFCVEVNEFFETFKGYFHTLKQLDEDSDESPQCKCSCCEEYLNS